jgi:hypothetical protein
MKQIDIDVPAGKVARCSGLVVIGPGRLKAGVPDNAEVVLDDYSLPRRPTAEARAKAALARTDSPAIRIIDDLVETLLAKGVLSETDLPQAAQDKLDARKAARANVTEGRSWR